MFKENVTQSLLHRALDGTWQRQRAIAHNIANHETPGFRAVRVDFEQALKSEMKRNPSPSPSAIRQSKIHMRTERESPQRLDGNTVDLDQENIALAKTQIQYQYLTRTLADYYARIRYAISEGRR